MKLKNIFLNDGMALVDVDTVWVVEKQNTDVSTKVARVDLDDGVGVYRSSINEKSFFLKMQGTPNNHAYVFDLDVNGGAGTVVVNDRRHGVYGSQEAATKAVMFQIEKALAQTKEKLKGMQKSDTLKLSET